MKVCIIQPAYSVDYEKSEEYFEAQLKLMEQCDDSMDLIVLPESCDIPCLAGSKEKSHASAVKFNERLLQAASDTAKRCHAILFANARDFTPTGERNTTHAFDREGREVGKYYKQHPTPGEGLMIDCDYSYEFESPTVIEIEGIRFAFLTCYDFYFYENFANIARNKVDVVIGCSHQRSDTHAALEMMSRFCAYNTNAYVVRSSVSMDENSTIGGASMIVSPDGTVLVNLESRVGLATAEIDVTKKYYKPAGFGKPLSAHYEYIEKGRRPWKYRPGGSMMVKHDALMPYPRTCAHRGFNAVAPENSMPAFGAAISLGAEEIEFDLWETKDHEIVSIHDSKLDRVSTGCGRVWNFTYEELLAFDFGVKYSEKFKGLKILKFEEILKQFSCHAMMNIHIKSRDNENPLDEDYLRRIIGLVRKYDCEKYVYFMSGNDTVLAQLKALAPDLGLCVGGGGRPWEIVDRAIALGVKKVQLVRSYFNREMIEKAHANGIRCNVFWSDDEETTREYLDMGVDCILTNDYLKISQIVKEYPKTKI